MAEADGLYARTLRVELATARREGLGFLAAWKQATDRHPVPEDWAEVIDWAFEHFRAAYEREPSRAWQMEAPNVTGRPPKPTPKPPKITRCRWGTGCDRPAIEGRRFCVEHGARLDAIRENAEPDWTAWQAWPKRAADDAPD